MVHPNQNGGTPQPEGPSARFRVKVWDLPTRLFHWALVVLVAVSFVTGMLGGTAMATHEKSGVALLVLVFFRLIWGFCGGREARFAAFVRGPKKVLRYALTLSQRDAQPYLGHNPLGGWSVLMLLAALWVQAGTGLFANDDILMEGPLFDLVSKPVSDWLTGVHHLNKIVLIILMATHVGAILFYLAVKKENLIYPMFSGVKPWHQDDHPSNGSVWLAAVILAAGAFMVYLVRNWL